MEGVDFPLQEVLARLGLALLFGCLIGLDRDLQGKHAGMRTFGLVALATAGITISTFAAVPLHPENAGRIVQGVLTGIGFLGAGVIMRRPETEVVTGLTTAAAVWFTAALAVIVGLGEYKLAWSLFGLGFLLLLTGRRIEGAFERLIGRSPPGRSGGKLRDE